MSTVLMSHLWEEAGLTDAKVAERLADSRFAVEWEEHPLRERLIDQAAKHVEQDGDPRAAAKAYYAICRLESHALAVRFAHSIFATYNHPDFDCVSPSLPKVYLSSYKEGTSVKPWFAE